MPILGKAIAGYLSKFQGLYSVELPAELADEMNDLVSACNVVTPNRAVLVADPPHPPGVLAITWPELLGWRTEDDRVFAWERGSREPDTSFRSVVRPFISNRFPGITGGECALELLARLSTEQLWAERGLP